MSKKKQHYLEDLKDPDLFKDFYDKHKQKCALCGKKLKSFLTGKRNSLKGIVCEDCYFDQLGEEIEKHPIGIGNRRR